MQLYMTNNIPSNKGDIIGTSLLPEESERAGLRNLLKGK